MNIVGKLTVNLNYDDLGDYEEWCAWSYVDVEEGYYAPFPPDVEGRVVSPDTVFGEDSDAVAIASVEHETGNENIPVSEALATGPGTPLLGLDDCMDVPDWWSSVATRQMGTSLVLEDTSDSPVPVGVCPIRGSERC